MGNPFEQGPGNSGGINETSNVEQEKEAPVVIKLHAMRHEKRENTGEGLPHEIEQGIDPDNRTPLKSEGIRDAIAAGRDNVDWDRARIMRSPRVRSVMTAALLAAGGSKEFSNVDVENLSLEEVEKMIQEMGGNEAAFRIDDRLNFIDDKQAPLGIFLDNAYHAKTYLKTILEDSDRMAVELASEGDSAYSGKAGLTAELFYGYFQAAKKLRKISEGVQKAQAEKHGADLKQSQADFERFMGSHQGILETFLFKAVEKAEGVEARDLLLEDIGNAGFDTAEGFDITITEQNGVVTGELLYTNKRPDAKRKEVKIALTEELFQSIMKDREDIWNRINEAKESS
jgi:hypothetical protein